MIRILSAAAAILSIAATPALAQRAGAASTPSVTAGVAGSTASGMPAAPGSASDTTSAMAPTTVNPVNPAAPPPSSLEAGIKAATTPEATTGAPATRQDPTASTQVNPPATAAKSGKYPACKTRNQDGCRAR